MKSTKKRLEKLRWNFGFAEKQHCEPAEQEELTKKHKNRVPLPADIHMDEGGFFRYVDIDELNEEERREFMVLKQLYYLRSIRNGVLVVAGVVVLNLLIYFLR